MIEIKTIKKSIILYLLYKYDYLPLKSSPYEMTLTNTSIENIIV